MSERYIDVWWIPLSAPDCPVFPESILSSGEQLRARHFLFERHARQFRASHAAVRLVLQHYLSQPADTIQFWTNSYGKPFIAGPTKVRFSLSHADDLAVVAVSCDAEIGVDVEAIRSGFSVQSMASCFTHAELEILHRASSAEARDCAFFRLWTRKEAVLKAEGRGLSAGMRNIDVSRAPDGLVRVETGPERLWEVSDLETAAGYMGALAGPPGSCHVRYRRLSP